MMFFQMTLHLSSPRIRWPGGGVGKGGEARERSPETKWPGGGVGVVG